MTCLIFRQVPRKLRSAYFPDTGEGATKNSGNKWSSRTLLNLYL